MSIPLIISLNIAKLVSLFRGTALPGYIGLKLQPNLINQIVAKNQLRSIVVTGTNGKTTTTRLIGSVLSQAGIGYCHNRSGSNLLQGIATTLINQSDLFGKIKYKLCVWEVDEATVPKALSALRPEIVVVTNLSRDQLDRYGEIDTLIAKWQKSFQALPRTSRVIVNIADPRLKSLKHSNLSYFGQKTPGLGLKYPKEYQGKFNYDSLWAAEAVGASLKLDRHLVEKAAKASPPAFGRGEIFAIKNQKYQINLVKNPASFRAVWQMLLTRRHLNQPLLLLLNDNIADGTDVSWIWDVPFADIAKRRMPVIVSGLRAYDLALRLKYSGLKPNYIHVETKLKSALDRFIKSSGSPIYIFPTYTAMLDLRNKLKRTPWN
jgi:UDP-N-acetylmuramyl tripeptide synthase